MTGGTSVRMETKEIEVAKTQASLRDRVVEAAQAVLTAEKAVGPLELFQRLRFLEPVHVKEWKLGNPALTPLEPHIQCGDKKRSDTLEFFFEWVRRQELEPFEASYLRANRGGNSQPLQITVDNDPEREALFRTHFRPANLTEKQKERIEKKANKVPDLTVFVVTSDESTCMDCQSAIANSDLVFLENKQPLCIQCADLDHLEFLPSGDAAMTRRSKKHSPLSAIVMKFNRRRKRYDRQGILVTSDAINQAELECEADSDQRAARRVVDAQKRDGQDRQLEKDMVAKILELYPSCPMSEAQGIARLNARRGSGTVGRSAMGRSLGEKAIALAVGAWVRHQHTNYDSLLMDGVARMDARSQIRDAAQAVLQDWQDA